MKTKIEQQVMAGVASVYLARKLTGRTALECYTLFLSAFGVTLFVSLPHVAANFTSVATGGVPGIVLYILSAVLGTKLIVQLALVIGALALLLLARDIVRPSLQLRFA